MPLNSLTQSPCKTITLSTQYIVLTVLIALLKYSSFKMCHIIELQANYGAPCSQLSEPSLLESHCGQKGLVDTDLESTHPPSIHNHIIRSNSIKLTFGRYLGAMPVLSPPDSGDRAPDLYHGNNDLF